MARRLDAGERARIEVLSGEGLGDAEIAVRLGRDRAAIWREEKRCGPSAHRARRAQGCADAAAGRPGRRSWPQTPGFAVWCASGSTSACRPMRSQRSCASRATGCARRRSTRRATATTAEAGWRRGRGPSFPGPGGGASRAAAAKGQALCSGLIQAHSRPARRSRRQSRARLLVGRSGQGQGQPLGGGRPSRAHQPPHPGGGPAWRLRRPKHRRSRRRTGPSAPGHGPHAHLGPGHRDGPLGRHRTTPPSNHPRPHQQHAPQTPPLAISPNRLRCPLSRPPVELAHTPVVHS